jgi:hypothetical protein
MSHLLGGAGAVALAALVLAEPGPLSDPVEVYALIEKVVCEPSEESPERIQVWGAFALAEGRFGEYYRSPEWGYLYFNAKKGEEEKCRAQWADLKRVAGSGECLGFGFRHESRETIRLRRAEEPPANPTGYPIGHGVQKTRNAEYGPIRRLMSLPKPLSPIKEFKVNAPKEEYRRLGQELTLVAKNCAAKKQGAKYLFEIERASAEVLASPPIPEGDEETKWQVFVAVEPGETITWRVRVIRDGLETAPVATARFEVKPRT